MAAMGESESGSSLAPGDDRLLTVEEVPAELAKIQFHVTEKQVKNWADRKRLPFFKAQDGRRRIYLSELHATLRSMQYDAVKKFRLSRKKETK